MGQRTISASELQLQEGSSGDISLISSIEASHQVAYKEEHPYQKVARLALCSPERRCAPLISTRGSGKSRMIIESWRMDQYNGPTLLIAGKNATAHWINEFALWTGSLETAVTDIIVITGMKPHLRTGVWSRAAKGERVIVICTYQTLISDVKRGVVPSEWKTVIADEAHKFRNKKSQAFNVMRQFKAKYLHPLTGTAIRKGPQDLWTLLHLAQPKLFPSYWKFVNTFCEVYDGEYGKEIIGPKNSKQLQALLEQYTVFVPDSVVDPYLPKKQWINLMYDKSPSQIEWYETLAEETIVQLQQLIVINQSAMTKLLRLRQLMCMPKVLDPALDDGGALECVLEKMAAEEDYHVVIFVPFVKAIKHVIARIEAFKLLGGEVLALHGGLAADEVGRICKRFDSNLKSTMVCSIAFAESFSLSTGRVAYFIGTDYAPDVMDQAADRIRRADSIASRVVLYKLMCRGSVDELVDAIRANYRNIGRLSIGALTKKILESTS